MDFYKIVLKRDPLLINGFLYRKYRVEKFDKIFFVFLILTTLHMIFFYLYRDNVF